MDSSREGSDTGLVLTALSVALHAGATRVATGRRRNGTTTRQHPARAEVVRHGRPTRRPAARLAVIGLLATLGACVDPGAAPVARTATERSLDRGPSDLVACDPQNGGLTLPAGFCAVVVVKDVGFPRQMVVRANGDLYVALDNSPSGVPGGILALRDTDGNGSADVRQTFGPTGGNGIALRNDQLFFAPDDRVLRYDFSGNELVPSTGPVTTVSGLPSSGDHHRKSVVVDASNGLLVNIGSATNSCQILNRTDFSPGINPCPELATRAGIWRFNASATNQTQGDGMRFATELRNMNALAINPIDQALYGVQNGRDQLWDNWPTLYTQQDDALLPAEELFRIERGKRYGWPYCYYDGAKKLKLLNPEYGGNGSKVGRCESRQLPIDVYPAHWAPLSLLFYTGSQFPSQYAGGAFIAFHGSRFDPTLQPAGAGYVVAFVPWANGKPSGPYQIFADNFAAGTSTPTGARHRAIGLAQGPDGSLYVSDDKGGWIWRIVYVGSQSNR